MKFLLFSIISFLIFVGCSLEVQRGIPVDLTKKTMTVPATGWKVFAIKKELRNAGWKLKISGRRTEENKHHLYWFVFFAVISDFGKKKINERDYRLYH